MRAEISTPVVENVVEKTDRAVDSGDHLSIREKIGYGLGDAGGTIITALIGSFLTYFYTDVFGIAPAIVGTIFLSLRVIDAFTDPMMGMLADRTRSRWGRYRPWQLWMALPMGAVLFLTFFSPGLEGNALVVYAIITYFLLSLCYTASNVPYCAMINAMTRNSKEMVACQSYRFALCGLAGLCITVGLPMLVAWFGQGNEARGYQWGVTLMAVLCAIMLLACFATVKERVASSYSDTERYNLKTLISNTWRNDQLVLMFFIIFLSINVGMVKGGALLYFIQYYLGESPAYTSLFFGVGFVGIGGSFMVKYIVQKIETVRFFILTNLVLGIASCLVAFIPGEYSTLWLALNALGAVFYGFVLPLAFAMMAFTDEYGEWKTGKRTSGMTFAFNLFFIKLAWATGGAIVSFTLSLVHYQPGLENQTTASVTGILLLVTVIPGVLHFMVALATYFFKVNERFLKTIKSDLAQRAEGTGEGQEQPKA
ncbi:MFS transporter [Kushneria aurantia]|uniref:MFS transporter n=1 Tax=Kushneria aurantia TaxID=504092 RepID=A0ABV6G4Z7_9GAMM|nr:MFS transporter [Kushneria aurantia]